MITTSKSPKPWNNGWRSGLSLTSWLLVATMFVPALTIPVQAGFHLWAVDEIYSNGDGSVQFIELRETSGGFGGQHPLASNGARLAVRTASATNVIIFPTNLPSGSANKSFIIGTASLAVVPGGIVPNYVVPNDFLFRNGANIRFGNATTPFDDITYGALPTNGTSAMIRSGATMTAVGTNSPRNYANQSNSIVPVKIQSASRLDNDLVIAFATATGPNGAAGPNYAVETKNNITSTPWSVATNVAGNGTTRTVALPIQLDDIKFFRLRAP